MLFHLLYRNCLFGKWWWLSVLYFVVFLAAFLLYEHTHFKHTRTDTHNIYSAKILSYTIYSKNITFPEFWSLSETLNLLFQLAYPALVSYTLYSVVTDMTAITGLDPWLCGAHVPLLMEDNFPYSLSHRTHPRVGLMTCCHSDMPTVRDCAPYQGDLWGSMYSSCL